MKPFHFDLLDIAYITIELVECRTPPDVAVKRDLEWIIDLAFQLELFKVFDMSARNLNLIRLSNELQSDREEKNYIVTYLDSDCSDCSNDIQ